MKWLILPATAAITLVIAAVPTVHAQMMPGQAGGPPMPKIGPGPKAAVPRDVPPPAVPGAASNSANVAPATITPAEMDPNDELFDAINRGDIVAARDALSRGADMGGRNVLGMTPMELSVDLGRNDISFLLLSMRGDSSGRRPPASATAATEKPQPAKPGKTRQAAQAVARAATPSQSAAPQNPRLFSGDGGAPNPNAGFLGFDSARR